MQNSVFSRQLVESIVDELKITDLAQATIGQVVLLASALEQRTGIPFIRMDQGVPGLSPNQVGIAAEKAALDTGIAAIYPAAEGVPELKRETSRFVKAFLNVDITPEACIPDRSRDRSARSSSRASARPVRIPCCSSTRDSRSRNRN